MSIPTQRNYFSRPELWERAAVAEQVAVADDLLALIPKDVATILDAGCGNGVVTNRLTGRWNVTGCDLSEEALRHVGAPSLVADLSCLPFADRQFDLVLSSDVLEHVPAPVYRQTLAELGRVAARYLLIAVPFREVLEAARISCPNCGNGYHAHLHQRSYGIDDVTGLFGPHFGPVAVNFSGERWKYEDRELVEAAWQASRLDYPFEEGICPRCASRRGPVLQPDGAKAVGRRFEALQAMRVAEGLRDMPPRSEMLVLFERGAMSRCDWPLPAPPDVHHTALLALTGLSIVQDPVNYPSAAYRIGPGADPALIAIPRRPAAIRTMQGSLGRCEVYDHVREHYRVCPLDDRGEFVIPCVPYGPRGCLLRLVGASADLQLHLRYQSADCAAIVEQCMGDAPEVAQLYARLLKAELSLQASNDLANGLEARRAEVEQRYRVLSEQAAGQACVIREQQAMIDELQACATAQPGAVLVVSHMYPRASNPVGGIFVHEQVKALRAMGVDARVVSGEPFWINALTPLTVYRAVRDYKGRALGEWEDYQGVPVIRFPYVVSNLLPFQVHATSYCHGLMRHAERLRAVFAFELIHAHTAYTDGSAAAKLASRYRVPLVITEHTGPFSTLTRTPYLRRVTQRSLNAADRVVAISSALLGDIRTRVALRPDALTQVIPNLVDTAFFDVAQKPDDGLIQLLWVGHFVEVKRVPVLLRAFAVAHEAQPRLRLNLVGDGVDEPDARALAASLGIDQHVKFSGRANREALREHYRHCDFLVISSTTETFGVVAIEALSCGRPVLSTRCGGPQDIIDQPMLGLLVGLSVSDLADGMLSMASSLKDFDARQIRMAAQERFSSASVAKRLLNVYAQVTKEQTPMFAPGNAHHAHRKVDAQGTATEPRPAADGQRLQDRL